MRAVFPQGFGSDPGDVPPSSNGPPTDANQHGTKYIGGLHPSRDVAKPALHVLLRQPSPDREPDDAELGLVP
jgi:hypothetical protein